MMRRVCIVTATRAEYGSLKCLMEDILNDDSLQLQLIVTGTHLSPDFGYTYKEIESDGFYIDKKIEMLLSSDTPIGVSKSMGLAQISFVEAFSELSPDVIIVMGDRYELIPIVMSANLLMIPVAHISGGELTEGALDELIRHAVTKLSQIHFTAMDVYSKRIIQMGEQPDTVFTVGELGLDNTTRITPLSRNEFELNIGTKLKKNNFLITYHPETTQTIDRVKKDFSEVLSALDELATDNSLFIFTKANADVGGRLINMMIDDYVNKKNGRAVCFSSLGQLLYISAMKYVNVVIGNSSSGIWETPSFKVASVNIGDRQKGRERAPSTIDTPPEKKNILMAINKALTDSFINTVNNCINPYGDGMSSKRMISVLKTINLSSLRTKRFFDIR